VSTFTHLERKKKEQFMETREAAQGVTHVPAVNEWFDLEVGYDTKGLQLLGKRTLRVKLVRLGPVRSFEHARKEAKGRGYRLVGAQAREPLKTRGIKVPVMFGGSDADAACLNAFPDGWKKRSGVELFGDHWWWLVTEK